MYTTFAYVFKEWNKIDDWERSGDGRFKIHKINENTAFNFMDGIIGRYFKVLLFR